MEFNEYIIDDEIFVGLIKSENGLICEMEYYDQMHTMKANSISRMKRLILDDGYLLYYEMNYANKTIFGGYREIIIDGFP